MKVKSFSDKDRRDAENYYRKAVREVSLSPGVTVVNNGMFEAFEALEKVELPDSVIIIGERAFKDCVNLRSITIPDNCVSIGRMAFMGCSSLEEVIISKSFCLKEIRAKAFENCIKLNGIWLPDGLTEICEDTLKNCKALERINIPNSVRRIGNFAFYNCKGLSNLIITSISKLEEIGVGAFTDTKIHEFISPDNLQVIRTSAFAGCHELNSLTLSPVLNELGSLAFSGISIDHLTIPGSLKLMPEKCFEHCNALIEVKLEEGIETIEGGAFYRCKSLHKVNKPKSLKLVADWDMEMHFSEKEYIPPHLLTDEKRRSRFDELLRNNNLY